MYKFFKTEMFLIPLIVFGPYALFFGSIELYDFCQFLIPYIIFWFKQAVAAYWGHLINDFELTMISTSLFFGLIWKFHYLINKKNLRILF